MKGGQPFFCAESAERSGWHRQMKKKALLVCGLAATVLAAAVPVYAAEAENEVSEGMFAWFLVQAYNSACSENGGTENLWENGVDGQDTAEWILDKAKDYTRQYLAVNQEFEEEGLKLRASETETIEETLERYWNQLGYGRYYADYGVTEDDFSDYLTYETKVNILYEEMSAELEASVTDEEICDYIAENGQIFEYIAVPYSDELAEDADEETVAAWVDTDAIYDSYRERLEDGEELDDLVKEVSENMEQAQLGISSSQAGEVPECLMFYSSTSFSSGFKAALSEAQADEIIYFDDVSESYQIIFRKKEFSDDWAGLENYRSSIAAVLTNSAFVEYVADWGSAVELDNEAELPGADEVREMFS
jgi:hypothetical protein